MRIQNLHKIPPSQKSISRVRSSFKVNETKFTWNTNGCLTWFSSYSRFCVSKLLLTNWTAVTNSTELFTIEVCYMYIQIRIWSYWAHQTDRFEHSIQTNTRLSSELTWITRIRKKKNIKWIVYQRVLRYFLNIKFHQRPLSVCRIAYFTVSVQFSCWD